MISGLIGAGLLIGGARFLLFAAVYSSICALPDD